jgi:endonuclease/exonuclease/phosphatase family metal-dependent hydrolase
MVCGLIAALLGLATVRAGEVPVTQPLRVMSWNIRHGTGTDGRLDLKRIARVIREARVHLVALQEVDRGVARTDRRDLPGELAALTGMTSIFSNNFSYQGGEYGNAILSHLPVLSWTNRHYRMLRDGEQRGLLEAAVEWQGRPLRFFSTHLDYRPDEAERLTHVEAIRNTIQSALTTPAIVAGDFNALPDSRVVAAMRTFLSDSWIEAGEGPGATYPSSAPVRRIDYFFLSDDHDFGPQSVRVLQSHASDHLPLVLHVRARGGSESE